MCACTGEINGERSREYSVAVVDRGMFPHPPYFYLDLHFYISIYENKQYEAEETIEAHTNLLKSVQETNTLDKKYLI